MKPLIPTLALAFALAAPALAKVDRRTPIVEAVEKVMPAVVNIGTERRVVTTYADPTMRFRNELLEQFFGEFFGAPPQQGYKYVHSLGSGVVVHPAGYILTNFHVIDRASRIQVLFADGSTYEAQFLAGDDVSDIALIKVDAPKPLQAVEFAADDDLLLGETVICMGNPYGLADSVTVGVLSAKNREARVRNQVLFRDILQTDAAVNPGNSGGPLLNINGELIGINVAIYQQAENIGFAVPVKRIRALLSRWFSPRMRKLWLGFDPGSVDGELRIQQVEAGGEAGELALREGDGVTAVNGARVSNLFDFNSALLDVAPGQKVSVTVTNREGERNMVLSLVPLPKPDGRDLAQSRLGVEFDLSPEGKTEGLLPVGLFVKSVGEGSAAARNGIVPGTLVTRMNGTAIKNLDDVGLALENVRKGDVLNVDLVRLIPSDRFTMAQRFQVQLTAD